MAYIIRNNIRYTGGSGSGENNVSLDASNVVFDDTNTQFGANNVQNVIEKLNTNLDEQNKNLDTLQCYDDNAEILIGTADGRNVYRKLVRQQLEGGFASFKLTNKPIFLIVSLDVFYAPEGQGIIVKGVLDNSTVVYQNGQMNLNLTSQTTANVICHITIEYEADE